MPLPVCVTTCKCDMDCVTVYMHDCVPSGVGVCVCASVSAICLQVFYIQHICLLTAEIYF